MKKKPAVFVDRDGTLIEEVHYLSNQDQINLYPFSGSAIRALNQSDFLTVLVTNQSGVARGLFTEEDLAEIHAQLESDLGSLGARLDRIYYCPHHPESNIPRYRRICSCRKPKPGMLHRAASDLHIDLSRSYMVGDRLLDLETGLQAGCKPILVLTGYGKKEVTQLDEVRPQEPGGTPLIVENLLSAVESILAVT